MNLTATKIKRLIKRKIATAVLVSAYVAAFATLGDGGGKKRPTNARSTELTNQSFSLRTAYNFRSNLLFNNGCSASKPQKFIMLNTVVTYQKGNTTYIVPLKKKVVLDKIRFNPTPSRF